MQPPDPGLSRRDRERQVRRDAIVAAARELFAEKGFAETTLDEIAIKAEFGKGTLYNYFPSGKEAILLAIFEELFDRLVQLIEQSFENGLETSFRARLNDFLKQCFAFYGERSNLFLILIREAHRVGLHEVESSRRFFQEQRTRLLESLATPIRAAVVSGELKDVPPHFLAHLILTNIQGCQTQFCYDAASGGKTGCPANALAMASFLTEMICEGVAADKTPV